MQHAYALDLTVTLVVFWALYAVLIARLEVMLLPRKCSYGAI